MVLSVSRLRRVESMSFTEGSVVIEGPAEACVGEIGIRNGSDRRLRLRGLPVALDGESEPSLTLHCREKLAPQSEVSCVVRLLGGQGLAEGEHHGRVVLPQGEGPAVSIRITRPSVARQSFTLAAPTEGFSGPPDDCRACLTLASATSVSTRVVPQFLARPDAGRRKLLRLPDADYQLVNEGPLGAGTMLRLVLPTTTPPGRYGLVLSLADGDTQIVAEVQPSTRLQLNPSMPAVQAAAGEKVALSVHVAHLGNVPVELPAAAPLWLEEVDWVGRTLVETLRASPPDAQWSDYLQKLYGRFRQDMQTLVRVALSPTDTPLEPGTTRLCQLELTLPDALRAGKRYRGFINIHQRLCVLNVFCNG